VNIEITFLELLPRDSGFGLGAVDDWHRDRSDEYIQILEAALKRIEDNRVKLPFPKWNVHGIGATKKENSRNFYQVSFRRSVTLALEPPDPLQKVLLTDNNEDPRHAAHPQVVDSKSDLTITKSCVVKLVTQGNDGSFGQVLALSLTNDDRKYEVAPLSQQNIFDREYKFVYPKDKAALEVLFDSILQEVVQYKLLSEEDVRQFLTELASRWKVHY
jgi:hypothetical protein